MEALYLCTFFQFIVEACRSAHRLAICVMGRSEKRRELCFSNQFDEKMLRPL